MKDQLLTESQVAELLQCSLAKLRNDRTLGRGLPYLKLSRSVRYLESDIQNYCQARRIEPRG